VDLGPNHGKLNMAFALNCDAILPPLHADFYSATSMCRMLEDKGVLSQWDEWRCKVEIKKIEVEKKKKRKGGIEPIRRMVMQSKKSRKSVLL
jgi:hypothetical protein